MVMRNPVSRVDPLRFGLSTPQSSRLVTPDSSVSQLNHNDLRSERLLSSAGSMGSGTFQRKPSVARAMSSSHVALEKMIYGNGGSNHSSRSSSSLSRHPALSRPDSGRLPLKQSPPDSATVTPDPSGFELGIPGLAARSQITRHHDPLAKINMRPPPFFEKPKARAETTAGKGWSTSVVQNLEAAEHMLREADGRKHSHLQPQESATSEEHSPPHGHGLGWATAAAAERREKRLQSRMQHEHRSPIKMQSPTKRASDAAFQKKHDVGDYFGLKPQDPHMFEENEHPHNASPAKKSRVHLAAPLSKFFDDTDAAPQKPPLATSDDKAGKTKVKRTGLRSSLERDMEFLSQRLNSESFQKSMSKLVARPRSPRSERLFRNFPAHVQAANDANDEKKVALAKLEKTQAEIKKTLSMSKQVMEMTSTLLVEHFKDVPDEELSEHIATCFAHFDINQNGVLDVREVQHALRQLGKPCSEADVADFFRQHLAPGARMDLEHFEETVRACHGWERPPPPPPAFDDCFSIAESGLTTDRTFASSRR